MFKLVFVRYFGYLRLSFWGKIINSFNKVRILRINKVELIFIFLMKVKIFESIEKIF